MRARRAATIGLSILIVVLVGISAALGMAYASMSRSAESALQRFYASDDAEEQLMDPLLLSGKTVVPRLTQEIERKDMPRRRYGIIALGHIGDERAVPVLTRLAMNPEEEDFIRGDALESVARIDRAAARRLAADFKRRRSSEYEAEIVREVLSDSPLKRRTRSQVILGVFHGLLFGD